MDGKYSSRHKIWAKKIKPWKKILTKNGWTEEKILIKLMNLYSINIFQRKFSSFFYILFINYFNILN